MKLPSKKNSVLVTLSVGLVVYLLSRIDPADILRVLSGFPPGYFLGGLALFVAGHFVRSMRMRYLLSGRAPVMGLFRIIALQTAAVGLMPLRTGEFSLLYLLKSEHDIGYADSAAVLMLAKALDFLVVVTLFFVSAGSLEVVPYYYGILLPWAGGLFFLIAASLFMMGKADFIYAKLPGMFRQGRLMEGMEKVATGVSIIRSRRLFFVTFIISLVLWTLLYCSNYLVLRGVGLELSVAEIVFFTTTMTLFINLPVHAPGALGTVEAMFVLLVGQMGVSSETAIPAGFAAHIVSIVFTLIFMLYGLSLLRTRKPEVPD